MSNPTFVEFTTKQGKAVCLCPDHIASFESKGQDTQVITSAGTEYTMPMDMHAFAKRISAYVASQQP